MNLLLRSVAVALAAAVAVVAGAAPPRGDDDWRWPVDGFRVVRDWEAPAHRYGPGHRGIDLAPESDDTVRAPSEGTVAFVGSVAGRPLLTIDHGDGVVTTLEPVRSDTSPGDPVGTVATGGHTALGAVHFGIRVDGEYVNPRLFVGGLPRAVLLPCC